MQRRRTVAIFTAPVVAAGLLLVGIIPATAAREADPVSPNLLVVHPSEAIAGDDGATFYPTGPIGGDTLVVIPNADGTLPGGLTRAQLVAAANGSMSEAEAEALGITIAGN